MEEISKTANYNQPLLSISQNHSLDASHRQVLSPQNPDKKPRNKHRESMRNESADFIVDPETSASLLKHGYSFVRNVGNGHFASCFLVQSHKYSNIAFVIKRVELNHSEGRVNESLMNDEIDSLQRLNHPSIIKLYDFFMEGNCLFLVLEFCSKGSMSSLLAKNGPIIGANFWYYAKQIVEGLYFCHSRHVSHRDIKPGNILIDSNNRLRVADFGLSNQFESGIKINQRCGSLSYMSPEILSGQFYDPFISDAWSLGVTFYNMATNELPYKSDTRESILAEIRLGNVSFPDYVDREIRTTILKLTRISPKKRITIEKLIEDPIFVQMTSPENLAAIVQQQSRLGRGSSNGGKQRLCSSNISLKHMLNSINISSALNNDNKSNDNNNNDTNNDTDNDTNNDCCCCRSNLVNKYGDDREKNMNYFQMEANTCNTSILNPKYMKRFESQTKSDMDLIKHCNTFRLVKGSSINGNLSERKSNKPFLTPLTFLK